MENPPHPNRPFTSTSTSDVAKSVYYHDVFRPPPNFPLPALAPCLHDYSEIFGALHSSSSRSSSSIPLLHLPHYSPPPPPPHFDYAQVFTASSYFQDMFGDGYVYDDDSPDDHWSPAQSEPLFDEFENRRPSDGEIQFNKSSPRKAHLTRTNVVPPYTFSQYESSVSWDGEEDEHVTNDVKHNEETKSCSSTPLCSGDAPDAHATDFEQTNKHGSDQPFITVADINLRTKPSNLPPPSRPPPPLVVKVNGSSNVEEDDRVFIEGRRNGDDEDVEVKHDSDKESTDVMRMSFIADERFLCLNEKETTASEPAIGDGNGMVPRKGTEGTTSKFWGLSNTTSEYAGAAAAWREGTEYIEVIENKINGQSFTKVEDCETPMQHMSQDDYKYQKAMDHEEFNQKDCSRKFVWSKEALESVKTKHTRWDEAKKNLFEMSEVHSSNFKKVSVVDDLSTTACDSQQLQETDLCIQHYEILERLPKTEGHVHDEKAKITLNAFSKSSDIKEKFVDAPTEENTGKCKQATLRVEHWREFQDVRREGSPEKVQRGGGEAEEIKKQYSEVAKNEYANKLEASEMNGSGVILKKDMNDGGGATNSYSVLGHEICGNEQHPPRVLKDNELLMEASKQNVNGLTCKGAIGYVENDKQYKMIYGRPMGYRIVENQTCNEEESFEAKETLNLSGDAGIQARESGLSEAMKPIEKNEHDRVHKIDLNGHDQGRIYVGQSKLDEAIATNSFMKHGIDQKKGLNGPTFSSEGLEELKTEPNCIFYKVETGVDDILDNEKLEGLSFKRYMFQDGNCNVNPHLPKQMTDSSLCEDAEASWVGPNEECSKLKNGLENVSQTATRDSGSGMIKGTQLVNNKDDIRDILTHCQETQHSTVHGNKVEDAQFKSEHIENALYTIKPAGSQRAQTREKNIKENFAAKDQKGWERMRRDNELENDHMRKLEEEREREREREKDRMAVDKVALQAHERSNVEARRRAERAAVERTSAEVRMRTMAGIWERLEKSSVETRLRNERTSAATWQRTAEKYSAAFKPNDEDSHFESSLNSNDLQQHSYSSAHFGAENESPQRCKARLERYRRTTERAASALAEKNRRDLLAQREKEERNRVAEVLDPEIKRWSNGKEGNLRALLSTLQYILGPDSGWQPVPLTEVITSAAVKRSYRKATLCVHPDKLQQRGATIQHKYICEKVFDLLKEAWNKFNSEEL